MRLVRHILCTATLSATLLLAVGTAHADEPAASPTGDHTSIAAGDAGHPHGDNTVWG
jgi:hypothetical protein